MTRTAWNFVLLMAGALCLQSCCCHSSYAQFVAAIHLPPEQCAPCRAMLPVEAGLRAEGCPIYTIDVKEHPEWAGAPGRGYPRYVYVTQYAGRNYYTNNVLVGLQTPGQLRRFCLIPYVTQVGSATRSAVRALFVPFPFLEW